MIIGGDGIETLKTKS